MDGQRIEFTSAFCAHLALLGIRGVAPGVRLVDPATAFEPPVELGFSDVWKGPVRIGAFSYVCPRGTLHGATVGRYCSIAEGVQVGMTRHPADWLTTSPLGYVADAFGFEGFLAEERPGWRRALPLADYDLRPATTIGNDVWIGADVWIKDGVRVGDGAVIGAHAVVTRDVEPYAIVAGNPARLIRYRFPEAVVERLRRIAWWRCSLLDLPGLDVSDPLAAIDALEAAIAEGRVAAYAPEPIGIVGEFARFEVVREVMERRAA